MEKFYTINCHNGNKLWSGLVLTSDDVVYIGLVCPNVLMPGANQKTDGQHFIYGKKDEQGVVNFTVFPNNQNNIFLSCSVIKDSQKDIYYGKQCFADANTLTFYNKKIVEVQLDSISLGKHTDEVRNYLLYLQQKICAGKDSVEFGNGLSALEIFNALLGQSCPSLERLFAHKNLLLDVSKCQQVYSDIQR